MEQTELNKVVGNLRGIIEGKSENQLLSLRLLEVIEMLISNREEEGLLIRDRLEDILKIRK
jgi:hypothetical protein